jgi:hypothetical protein
VTRVFKLRPQVASAALCALLGIAGCAQTPPPVTFTLVPWSYEGDPGLLLHTAHYDIYTTIKEDELRTHICDVMEGALAQYQRLAPGVPLGVKPMDCYIFATRGEWEDFTRRQTGIAARIYLQINRGGYTLRDKYVAYNVGEAATLSVAAHEGWHLFSATHFKGRLPPFLEEGCATLFEDFEWQDGQPTWKLTRNRSRLQALRRAVQGNYLYPLDQLSLKHAGNVVNESGNHIDAFYAGSWAFATFLWAAQDAKYRPAMRAMMSDVADGTVFDPTGSMKNSHFPWNPAGVQPMLEHYLGMNMQAIDAEYQKYIRKIAFDDYAAQWD